uniref:uncharacterized protein LOC100179146 n=1 Tax=Ciona intestinalis TaxID=7719 RepID=UPI000180B8EE|nr:uncharacterized protein LOC100179146 [Ciona intestinalis]|eukprot:XP_002130757.1 uncharacterized protein LOC100179146 [Ciona intestinalis]
MFRYVVFMLCMLHYINGHTLDMGACTCSCSNDRTGLASSSRGEAGPPGKAGPAGDRGPAGPPGVAGPPGEGFAGSLGTPVNPGTSCSHLQRAGIVEDGVYSIRSQDGGIYQTYCDMTSSNDKAWSLVGSIHENNILGNCTFGDKWSSEEGNVSSVGITSWESMTSFGNVESVTSQDYKNPGYFNMGSRNIMVWHVPNETPLNQIKQRSKYQYKTTNNFLERYNTLYGLFKNSYPLRKVPEKHTNVVDRLMAGVVSSANRMVAAIPSFHRYTYDCSGDRVNCISDGGSDVFDTGNKIQYSINGGSLSSFLYYGESYLLDGVEILTWKEGHPFIALAWIGNSGSINSFKLKVTSNMGADGSGSVSTITGSLSTNRLTLSYKANHVSGASDPSAAQVFFHIYDTSGTWNSNRPTSVSTPLWETGDTQNMNDEYLVSGSLRNIVVGYVLLSKTSGSEITQSQITAALRVLAEQLENVDVDVEETCSSDAETLAVPVTFLKGESAFTYSIPLSIRASFLPGFVHFRAFSNRGLPSALCPGVKSTGCRPSSMCVGGLNTFAYKGNPEECGDFGSWAENRREDDVTDTILVFYDG